MHFRPFLLLALLFIAPAAAAWQIPLRHGQWYLLGWYAVASIATYILYATDKRRAQTGAQRTSESQLHLFELAGGWPGAFLAQQRLRHKSAKLPYRVIFWLIVALHQFVAVDYALHGRLSRQALDTARATFSTFRSASPPISIPANASAFPA